MSSCTVNKCVLSCIISTLILQQCSCKQTFNANSDRQWEGETITCNGVEDCEIICDREESCKSATLKCPSGYACDITCTNNKACAESRIEAADSSSLTISDCATGSYTCKGMTIYFPPNVGGEKKASLAGDNGLGSGGGIGDDESEVSMTFYAIYGWNDIDFTGYSGSFQYGFSGTMYCTLGYGSSCSFANAAWSCANTGDICNDPPSSSPTTSPTDVTSAPTTENPTTSMPTTATPTTATPTTSIPTTANPTTSSPTTSSPTKTGTPSPTAVTGTPSKSPTRQPSNNPSISPTTQNPTSPTQAPSENPTKSPSTSPTKRPTPEGYTYPPTPTPTSSSDGEAGVGADPTKAPTESPILVNGPGTGGDLNAEDDESFFEGPIFYTIVGCLIGVVLFAILGCIYWKCQRRKEEKEKLQQAFQTYNMYKQSTTSNTQSPKGNTNVYANPGNQPKTTMSGVMEVNKSHYQFENATYAEDGPAGKHKTSISMQEMDATDTNPQNGSNNNWDQNPYDNFDAGNYGSYIPKQNLSLAKVNSFSGGMMILSPDSVHSGNGSNMMNHGSMMSGSMINSGSIMNGGSMMNGSSMMNGGSMMSGSMINPNGNALGINDEMINNMAENVNNLINNVTLGGGPMMNNQQQNQHRQQQPKQEQYEEGPDPASLQMAGAILNNNNNNNNNGNGAGNRNLDIGSLNQVNDIMMDDIMDEMATPQYPENIDLREDGDTDEDEITPEQMNNDNDETPDSNQQLLDIDDDDMIIMNGDNITFGGGDNDNNNDDDTDYIVNVNDNNQQLIDDEIANNIDNAMIVQDNEIETVQ